MNRPGSCRVPSVIRIACIGLLAAFLGGCSGRFEDAWSRARPRVYPAGGLVEYAGKPAGNLLVSFSIETPDPKRSGRVLVHQAVGITDAQGRFTLKTFDDGDGAVAGTHAVRIEPMIPAWALPAAIEAAKNATPPRPPPVPAPPVSARYADFKASGLSADVSAAGPNEFVFRLTE